MIGAIYGDKAGSIYEYSQISEIKSIEPEKLILDNSFYSDDTIETIAVMDAIYKTLLMGGDTDTNSCIVGSVAEAMYGLTEMETHDALDDLPNEFKIILKKYYDKH